jgi:hypothetical protein
LPRASVQHDETLSSDPVQWRTVVSIHNRYGC